MTTARIFSQTKLIDHSFIMALFEEAARRIRYEAVLERRNARVPDPFGKELVTKLPVELIEAIIEFLADDSVKYSSKDIINFLLWNKNLSKRFIENYESGRLALQEMPNSQDVPADLFTILTTEKLKESSSIIQNLLITFENNINSINFRKRKDEYSLKNLCVNGALPFMTVFFDVVGGFAIWLQKEMHYEPFQYTSYQTSDNVAHAVTDLLITMAFISTAALLLTKGIKYFRNNPRPVFQEQEVLKAYNELRKSFPELPKLDGMHSLKTLSKQDFMKMLAFLKAMKDAGINNNMDEGLHGALADLNDSGLYRWHSGSQFTGIMEYCLAEEWLKTFRNKLTSANYLKQCEKMRTPVSQCAERFKKIGGYASTLTLFATPEEGLPLAPKPVKAPQYQEDEPLTSAYSRNYNSMS